MKKNLFISLAASCWVLIFLLSLCCFGGDEILPQVEMPGDKVAVHARKDLQYLKRTQNDDGSWGKNPERQAGLTSVCILAFIENGEMPSSEEYGTGIIKGIKRLITFADERVKGKSPATLWEACENGLLFWALAETYSMTKIPIVELEALRLKEKLVKDQAHLGFYKDKAENDIIVSSFMAIGLIMLSNSATDNTSSEQYEKLFGESLNAMIKDYSLPDGSFARKRGGENPDFTATCLATRCMFLPMLYPGGKEEPLIVKSLRWIAGFKFSNGRTLSIDWENPPGGEWAPLSWYLMKEEILFGNSGSGPIWAKWNKEYLHVMMRTRADDGSWTVPVKEKIFFEDSDLSIWSTAFISMLVDGPVSYRWVPRFKTKVFSQDESGISDKVK
jgi:hypothetical protein